MEILSFQNSKEVTVAQTIVKKWVTSSEEREKNSLKIQSKTSDLFNFKF